MSVITYWFDADRDLAHLPVGSPIEHPLRYGLTDPAEIQRALSATANAVSSSE